ncbi:type III pantothenate kinase [Halarcobacter anaerophilus]|uniref:type III pantothenate kinase n=1 Tax=Halarcobacter anaerophilus TaxID=877500 RepID=UPI0005C99B75|nr:type III pantothenate kinase [Halarcobacter anaerophilus]
MILCDIGNTTYHFLIDGLHKKYLLQESLPKFKETIFYISVNDNAAKKLEKNQEKCVDLEEFLDFETKYKGMGIDRKVVCLGVENAIIVDAGSAITVDIMENFKHKGGFILPGISRFINTYKKISVKLDYEINTKVNLDTIPLCTQDAISYSILKSIILPIKEISKDRKIIFTGGDGEFLSKYFDNCIYKDDLIFKNMKGIINANNRIA